MPSRAPVRAWIAASALVLPSIALAQERAAPDVVEAIVRDGPRAIAIRADVDVVRREQQARLAFPNPAVAYSREGAGFTEFLQVEQPLPIFGVRAALARAGVAATAAAEAERDARFWDLRAEAARLVARLLAAQARVEATTTDVQAVERLIEVLHVREREGEGSRFDRLRAEQELADLKQVAVSASIDVSDTRATLTVLLPGGTTITRLTGTLYQRQAPTNTEVLVTRAPASRAELRALQLTADRFAREADAAGRARLPAPLLTGGLKRADNDNDRERGAVFGVSVAVPLFDTGRREAARWTAEGARVAAERAAIERQVRTDIIRASEALALRQRALDEAAVDDVGTELVSTAEVAYREGEVGILALLDAVRAAARARMRNIEMRLDARLAQIALERAVGDVLWP